MRTAIVLALGIWIGKNLSRVLSQNHLNEHNSNIRAELERFMREHLPSMGNKERRKEIGSILK